MSISRPKRPPESYKIRLQKKFDSFFRKVSEGSAAGGGKHVRRADWRFLLPTPTEGFFQHLVLLGGSAGRAKQIVDIGFARRVSREIPKGPSADALIILSGAGVALEEAISCLAPGGSLYCEIDRRLPSSFARSPGRIRRLLRREGLSLTGLYWVRPSFTRREICLPLDVDGAISWYLRTLSIASTPGRRLLELGLRTLSLFGSRLFALLAPCYAVTAVASPTGGAPSLLRHLEPGRELGAPELHQAGLRFLMLTRGEDDLNRVVIFPFSPSGRQPVAVLKIPRVPERSTQAIREQKALEEIRGCLDETMRRSLPVPFGTVHWGPLTLGVESYLGGRLLAARAAGWGFSLRRKVADLMLAAEWLTEFHEKTVVRRIPLGSAGIDAWVEGRLAAYERAIELTEAEQRLFGEVRRRAISLAGTLIPIVWCHRAFSPWNICRTGGEVRVTDWEEAEPGLPLVDLLYFSLRWSHQARKPRRLEDRLVLLRELFCEPARGDRAFVPVHAAIGEYMKRLEIDRGFFPLALVIMTVEHAIGRFRRAQTLDRRSASGRERHDNDYVNYIGVLAECTDSLFADRSVAATSGAGFPALSDKRGRIDVRQAHADRRMSTSIPILMYHEVTSRPPVAYRKYAITPRTFARQMRWLAFEGYHPISLQDLFDARTDQKRLPTRPVIVTFDDGYRDCVNNAVPILKEHGFTATFFIVAGLVGKTSRWLVKERGFELPLADWSSLRDLRSAGLELGSHGMTHARLTELSSAVCREELLESRQLMEDRLGHEVRHLAYPFGSFDHRVRALAEEVGYRSGCSVRIGLSSRNDDSLALARVPINGDENLSDFICRIHTARTVAEYFEYTVRGARQHIRRGIGASP